MKICDQCKKSFDDDMNYCPYCGKKVMDDKDELKKAMADLMNESNSQEDKEVEIKEEVKVVSRVDKQRKLNEEKENQVLNKILISIIVLLLSVFVIFGGIFLWKKISSSPQTPVVMEEEKQPEKQPEKKPEKQPEKQPEKKPEKQPEKTSGSIAFDNDASALVSVDELLVSEEDGQVRLDVKLNSKVSGELYLKDSGSLNIGPIQVKMGENSFYFLVSGSSDYSLYVESDEGTFSGEISKDKISDALKGDE